MSDSFVLDNDHTVRLNNEFWQLLLSHSLLPTVMVGRCFLFRCFLPAFLCPALLSPLSPLQHAAAPGLVRWGNVRLRVHSLGDHKDSALR